MTFIHAPGLCHNHCGGIVLHIMNNPLNYCTNGCIPPTNLEFILGLVLIVRKDKKRLNMPNMKGGHSLTSTFYTKLQFNI